jgi:hypothetical protein
MTRGGEDRRGPCSIANAMTTVLDPHPPIPQRRWKHPIWTMRAIRVPEQPVGHDREAGNLTDLQVPRSVGVSRG